MYQIYLNKQRNSVLDTLCLSLYIDCVFFMFYLFYLFYLFIYLCTYFISIFIYPISITFIFQLCVPIWYDVVKFFSLNIFAISLTLQTWWSSRITRTWICKVWCTCPTCTPGPRLLPWSVLQQSVLQSVCRELLELISMSMLASIYMSRDTFTVDTTFLPPHIYPEPHILTLSHTGAALPHRQLHL